MASPDLGKKRTCMNCEARFYDLGKDPAICPKCGTSHPLDAFLGTKKGKAGVFTPKKKPETPDDADAVANDDDEDIEVEGDTEDPMLEDDDDDDDDVSDVIGGVESDDDENT